MSEPARSLIDYHLDSGRMASWDGAAAFSADYAVVPFDSELLAVVCHTSVAVDADVTFDLIVNDSDSGVDCVAANGAAGANGGFVMRLTQRLYLEAGSSLYVQSNGEQVAGGDAWFTFLFRSQQAFDRGTWFLQTGTWSSMSSNQSRATRKWVAPVESEVVLATFNATGTLDPPAGGNTLSLEFDHVKLTASVNPTVAVLNGEGPSEPLRPRYPDGSPVSCQPGQSIWCVSGGEQVTTGQSVCGTWQLKALYDLNRVFLYGGCIRNLETLDDLSQLSEGANEWRVVVPYRGRIISAALATYEQNLDAETTVDVLLNGADTGQDLVIPNGHVANTGLIVPLVTPIEVDPGDAIQLRSNGECSGVGTQLWATLVMEQM